MKGVVQTPWTDEERAMLRRLRQNGVTLQDCAVMMGRSFGSVQRQIRYLGLSQPAKEKMAEAKAAKPKAEKPQTPQRIGTGPTLPPLPSLRHD